MENKVELVKKKNIFLCNTKFKSLCSQKSEPYVYMFDVSTILLHALSPVSCFFPCERSLHLHEL